MKPSTPGTFPPAGFRSPLLFAILVLVAALPARASAQQPPLRILAAGSSSLYYHNQPKILAQWLTRYAGRPATAELVGRSGTGVHVYLRPAFQPEYGLAPGETVLQKIATGRYDYLLLQIPAEFIAGPEGEEHERSLDSYCQAIRTAGGEPVFYEMGWGRDKQAELGRHKILAAALRNRVTRFAPCSSTWDRVRRERPDLDLQNPPDTAHPGTLGAYLNLCCLYAAISDQNPTNLPTHLNIWPHLTPEDKLSFTPLVTMRSALQGFDAYDAALPSWMRRLVIAAQPATVPEPVADYLQQVAGEEVQRFRSLLRVQQTAPPPSKTD